jgi:hypothetical protein
MKRYGDNLPSSAEAEIQNQHGKDAQFMPSGCAVRQDMVAFVMPAETPNKRKARNIFSFFKLGTKKTEERGG